MYVTVEGYCTNALMSAPCRVRACLCVCVCKKLKMNVNVLCMIMGIAKHVALNEDQMI